MSNVLSFMAMFLVTSFIGFVIAVTSVLRGLHTRTLWAMAIGWPVFLATFLALAWVTLPH